jgi:hypothetical protein
MGIQTIAEIRRANLLALVDKYGGRDQLAHAIGRDRNQIDQLLTKKNMGSNLARSIESALKLPVGRMDAIYPIGAAREAAINEGRAPYRISQDDNVALLDAWKRLDAVMRAHVLAIIEGLINRAEKNDTGSRAKQSKPNDQTEM